MTEPDLGPDAPLPPAPIGDQVAWYLRHVRTRGSELSVEELAAHMTGIPPWTPEGTLDMFRRGDERPFRVTRVQPGAAGSVEVRLDFGDDRPMTVALTVEDAPPHLITRVFWARAIPEDIVIRAARDTDGPGLNRLEVEAPMQIGSRTLVYDRGEDFLGFGRLMGDNICFVADRDGDLLGLACGTSHVVRVGGADYRVMLLHHVRVPVQSRGLGVFSALNNYVFAAFHPADGAYGYTAVDNAEAWRIGGPGTWSTPVLRAVFDCGALAGPDHGRAATPADAGQIAELLNDGHAGEEMYHPHNSASFTERMGRASDLYSWGCVRLGDNALIGVWPAGLQATFDGPDRQRRSIRAIVLDHGFRPGSADEFERLLRAACSRLLEAGHSELAMVTSEGSPSFPVVSALARELDTFAFRMSVPEPEGTRERGLYVDAVYF
jgi:hypothetical protein